MRIVKLYEEFNLIKINNEVDDLLVDLKDLGFSWDVDYSLETNDLEVLIYIDMDTRETFRIPKVRDSIELMVAWMKEKYGIGFLRYYSDSGLGGIELDNERLNRYFISSIKVMMKLG